MRCCVSGRPQNNPLDLTSYFCKVHAHALGVLELVQTAFVPNGLLNTVMSSQLIMITYAVSYRIRRAFSLRLTRDVGV